MLGAGQPRASSRQGVSVQPSPAPDDLTFSFSTAYFSGAWVFIGAFVAHVLVKFPPSASTRRRAC